MISDALRVREELIGEGAQSFATTLGQNSVAWKTVGSGHFRFEQFGGLINYDDTV